MIIVEQPNSTVYGYLYLCILGQNAIPLLSNFFELWPNAEAGRDADWSEIADLMQPLGLNESRAKTIIRFSGASPNRPI